MLCHTTPYDIEQFCRYGRLASLIVLQLKLTKQIISIIRQQMSATRAEKPTAPSLFIFAEVKPLIMAERSSVASENMPRLPVGSFDICATRANINDSVRTESTDTARQMRSIAPKLFNPSLLPLYIRKTSKYADRAYSEVNSFITSSYRRG